MSETDKISDQVLRRSLIV